LLLFFKKEVLSSFWILRMRASLILLLLLCTAAISAPRLVPVRDVTIDYVVHAGDARPQGVRVSIEAGGAHLRIAGQDLPLSILVDRPAGVAHVLVPLLRAYSSVDIARYDPERGVLRGAVFTRGGTERLAGGRCTDWRAASASGTASACITEGGVILKGEFANRNGAGGAVLATSVDYAPLPRWTWSLPAGFHDMGPLSLEKLGLAPR
jgi:hypothetical protein